MFVFGLLPGVPFGGPPLDLGLGPGDGRQAFFAARQLGGQVQSVRRRLAAVRFFGLTQQFGHLGLELGFKFVGVFPTQGLVLGGVGLDLGAVEADLAQFQAAHLLGDQQNLHEQRRQLWQKSLAKGGYRVVIRMVVGGDVPEGHRVVGRLLQLAAGKNAGRVAVKQQGQQHLGMMGLGAAPGVGGLDRGQVELANNLDDESRQVPLGQPVVHRRRHQVQRFPINLTKGITHGFVAFSET